MTADEYHAALKELGLKPADAAWLFDVGERTARHFATSGPSGPAALAIEALLFMSARQRKAFLAQQLQQEL